MKKKLIYSVFFLSLLIACRKPASEPASLPAPTKDLSLRQIQQWYHADTAESLNWKGAENIHTDKANYWLVGLPGQPTFQLIKQGYRKLVFYRDSASQIQQRILEIIPDGNYLQRKGKVSQDDFTGRIFTYDRNYHLIGGRLYAGGKVTGLIRPKTKNTPRLKTQLLEVDCTWYQESYADGDGGITVYAEKMCNYSVGDGSSGSGDVGGYGPAVTSPPQGGGAANTGTPVSAPEVSNLPGEGQPAVNPKELVTCFGNIPDQGATMQVTVYVQEPFPGTSFNIGPNSVGHTAIGLTKTNGSSTVTQVVGFYPDASGIAKMHAPSKIVLNNALNYNVSITYTVSADDFNKIAGYIANPPGTYDLMDFNCTSFAYYACQAGGITLPNPINTVGLGGAGGVSTAMTPAGLGSSIETLKDQSNVNQQGGNTPNSKGPCY
jgi:hypothetical protein